MKIALITGSAGLIGSEASTFFAKKGFDIVGIDNNMREVFFGAEGSTQWNQKRLTESIDRYQHHNIDIRDAKAVDQLFSKFSSDIKVVIHTAAQPSHDWAAKDPQMDFSVNANGTLNLLEATRKYCMNAPFIFTSTNKVYGDTPNRLPLVEQETRWEIESTHPYFKNGIDENMSIDQSTHSLFGVSKVAADLLVQEYGHYFKMKTGVFRGGCLTGPNHSGAPLHGFLAYLVKCVLTGTHYTIHGYKGKQVRDNIHSFDLINMFWHFFENPRVGEVYNAGGGRHSNCSMLEAIKIAEKFSGKKLAYSYADQNRIGDHIWWLSDVSKFKKHYPQWNYQYDINTIIGDICAAMEKRL